MEAKAIRNLKFEISEKERPEWERREGRRRERKRIQDSRVEIQEEEEEKEWPEQLGRRPAAPWRQRVRRTWRA
jgi:hypothetical protein